MLKKANKMFGTLILDYYKKRVQKKYNPNLKNVLDTALEMMKHSKYCFLITNTKSKWPHARMVQPIIDLKNFEIWLGTNPNLRKIKEINENPYVTVAFYSNSENANLIVYGKAVVETGIRERVKHWIGSWKLFFPNGPGGDDFVSIRIEPHELELMNFKKYLVPEPFGLKPIKLVKNNEEWRILS